MNYFEKHIGDYIRDTVSLTMLEDGAYNRLMDQCYQTERPLPLDRKMVYRLARATSAAEKKAVDFVLDTFFQESKEGFVQKRIQAEIERYQEKQRKAKASAEARWNKSKGNANAYETHAASDMRTHSEGNAHQTPDTKHQKEENTMSGKPDDAAAREVLDYLNEQTGNGYRPVDTNLKLIRAKLDSGATVDDCKAVIDAKVGQWGSDPKMAEYLRPTTLFRASNFEQYLGQLAQQSLPNPAAEAALADGATFIPGVGRCY